MAAIYDETMTEPQVIPLDHGNNTLTSVVSFESADRWLVGELALDRAAVAPGETVRSVKRQLGTMTRWTIHDQEYTPVDISALILGKVKEEVEKFLGEPVKDVVITVPAYFKDDQLRQTREAGKEAGLNVMRLLPEPAAAALAYGLRVGEVGKTRKFMVYDLGGGTFDVCIMDIKGFDYKFLNIDGNSKLGGDDFDWRMIQLLSDAFREQEGVDVLDESTEEEAVDKRIAKQKLWNFARSAKEKLSELPEGGSTEIEINNLYQGKSLKYVLERGVFEKEISDLLSQTREIMEGSLKGSGLDREDISRTILMGGSTLVPKVRDVIKEVMDREPYGELSATEGVAMGAAIFAYFQGVPDSAIQAKRTTEDKWNLPETLGISVIKGGKKDVFCPLIKKGVQCPFELTWVNQRFTTIWDNQDFIYVKIYQQPESETECKGDYVTFIEAKGIRPAKAREPKIRIKLGVDQDRIVIAEAYEIRNDKPVKLESTVYDPGQGPVEVKPLPVDIVLVVDTTDSMEPYIEGVKMKISEFADQIASTGTDYRLGLVDFKDLLANEPMRTFPFTEDVGKVRSYVEEMLKNYGGDAGILESSLDALMKAAENAGDLRFNDKAEKIFILITDAPPHIRGEEGLTEGFTIEEVKREINSKQISIFVVSEEIKLCKKPYTKLVTRDDFFFGITDMSTAYKDEAKKIEGRDALANILNKVAAKITDITLTE